MSARDPTKLDAASLLNIRLIDCVHVPSSCETSCALALFPSTIDAAGQKRTSATLRNSVKMPVAGALDDAPVMGGDRGIGEIATEAPQAR